MVGSLENLIIFTFGRGIGAISSISRDTKPVKLLFSVWSTIWGSNLSEHLFFEENLSKFFFV